MEETLTKRNAKIMSNNYENLREQVKTAIKDGCVRKSKDGLSTSYDWSFAKACNSVAEVLVLDNRILPDELRNIVRFEFNKLKESILSGSEWTHTRTRQGVALVNGSIVARRIDTSEKSIPLKEQLEGAIVMLDKIGKQIGTASLEKKVGLQKRERMLLKEILFLRATIAENAKLVAEINTAPEPAVMSANNESIEQAKA